MVVWAAMKDEKISSAEQFRVVDKRRHADESTEEQGDQGESRPIVQDEGHTGAESESGASAQGAPIDFSSFIVTLATQTLVLLGEMPNPETNVVSTNLAAAQQTIDILEMLQEKTKGNLSRDEQLLLTEILASLQMSYVQKMGGVR